MEKKSDITSLLSPLPFFVIIMAIFFMTEIIVMHFLKMFPANELNHSILDTYSLLDAAIMVTFSAPLVWWFITKQNQIEEKIRKESEFTANLLKGLSDGFAVIDHEEKQILVNDELCKMTGYSQKELLNQKPPFNYWAEEGLNDIKGAFEKTLKGIEGEYELIFKRKDGERFIALVRPRKTTNPNGNVIFFATVKDITERKQSIKALKESEERYRRVVDFSPDGIIVHNLHELTFANKAAAKILGAATPEEIVGKTIRPIIHPDYRKTVNERLRMEEEGKAVPLIEIKFLRFDGTPVDVEVTAIPLINAGKLEVHSIVRDITERKKTDDQIKNSLKEKELLLREIHHRVKNNMQIISSLLNLQDGYSNDKNYHDVLKDCQHRIFSMSLVHENLYQSENFTKIEIKNYIRSLLNNLFQSYGINKGAITLNSDVEIVYLGIDLAIPCGLIINELITNSIKYAFPNGREGKIKITLKQTIDNMLELVVSDNGIGIPADLDFRNTRSLGLHVVTMLAEDQLEGEISLDRSKGTEFRIRFKERIDV